jgi:hypothetical protein
LGAELLMTEWRMVEVEVTNPPIALPAMNILWLDVIHSE